METQGNNHLLAAVEALRAEEKAIQFQIEPLNAKLQKVRAAIIPIEALLRDADATAEAVSKLNQAFSTELLFKNTGEEGQSSVAYADMPISTAIFHFLRNRGVPMTAPLIAQGLLNAGYKSKSADFTNLVGSSLRRLKDKEFFQDQHGRWYAKQSGVRSLSSSTVELQQPEQSQSGAQG